MTLRPGLLLLLTLAVANGLNVDTNVAKAEDPRKMWRIKMQPGAELSASHIHFDKEHQLDALSGADASLLRERHDVISVEEFHPHRKHSISLGALKAEEPLRLHALHMPGYTAQSVNSAQLVSTGVKTAVWECTAEWSACVESVSALPEVYYVEGVQRSMFRLMNAWSSGVTQSGMVNNTPFWDAGIRGDGQIVGCGDTGVDVDSCMYWDAASPRFMFDELQPENRKIIKYISKFGNDGDNVHGHGSHVTGSITGNPRTLAGHAKAGVSNFAGMAPNAKLIFTDVDDGSGESGLSIPDSLDGSDGSEGLFPVPYADGARIHSNSWGSSTAVYSIYAQQIDSFTYDNPDMLVLVANGNDGEEGVFSVGSPATCKNCLGVGAAQNDKGAYDYGQMAIELIVSLPESCVPVGSASNMTFEAVPAAFAAKVDGTLEASLMLATPSDGCTPLEGRNYTGMVVVIERGTCSFAMKAYNAQSAGAAGFVVTNNDNTPPFGMGDTAADRQDEPITIKGVMVSKAAGIAIKSRSAECQVSAHEQHEGSETHWSTLDETPAPGLPAGVWSGIALMSGETGCISMSCSRLGASNMTCTGTHMPKADAGGCDDTRAATFSATVTGDDLIGFQIDFLIDLFVTTPVRARGIARWKTNQLEIVMVDPACAADVWCTSRGMRPADFDTANPEFAKWALVMPADGVAYADPFSVPEVVEMFQAAFERSTLFGGLQASLGLAATTKFNSTNLAGFTSRGPTLDGRIKPDVTAPGHTIYSTFSDGEAYTHQCGEFGQEVGSTITTMSGTSMATPITAGSAALVRQYFADGWLTHDAHAPAAALTLAAPPSKDSDRAFNPSSALVRAVLINSADDMQGYVQVKAGGGMFKIPAAPSFYQGYGRIHLSNTLCLASHSTECSLFALEAPALTNSSTKHHVRVTVGPNSRLKVTLTWTDPAGNPAAPHALVNDLDLSVAAEEGSTHIGNQGLYGDGPNPDGTNNEEQVVLTNTKSYSATYDVLVRWVLPAVQTNHSDAQDFALVITSDQAGMQVQDNHVPSSCPAAPTVVNAGVGLLLERECSNNGLCNNGVCECYQGFVGAACGALACPGNCSDAGSCVEDIGRCNCEAGRFGAGCEYGPCGGHLELAVEAGEEGALRSTMMPASGDITGLGLDAVYGDNMECDWTLSAPEGYSVKLDFSFFSTEEGYDFLYVYEGDTHQELTKASGDDAMPSIVSTGSTLKVRFTSDVSANTQGFAAMFSATTCHGGCSGNGLCLEATQAGVAGECLCEATYFGPNCQLQLGETAQCETVTHMHPDVSVGSSCAAVDGIGGTYTYDSALAAGAYTNSESGATFICTGNESPEICYLNIRISLGADAYSLQPLFQATCDGPCTAEPPTSGWSAVEGSSCNGDSITVEQVRTASVGCSDSGTCGEGGVCACDEGRFTAAHSAEQCDSSTQCGTPYEITQASQLSSLTLSSNRAPSSSWQGPCEIHLDLAHTDAAPQACVDDPIGQVAAWGSSCSDLVALGCSTDLSATYPVLPVGSLVSVACPLSCDSCTNSSSGSGSGSGEEDSYSLDLVFAFMGTDWADKDTLRVEYVAESGERVAVNMTEIMGTANSTGFADTNYTTLTVPSKDVYISYTVGAPEHSWYVIIAWQAAASGTIDYPTMSPTAPKDNVPTEAPTVGDTVPTKAPTVSAPVRSHAQGQVRLVGYLTYDEVSDTTSDTYREFVNMFETDVENFERASGRETHCIVDNLHNGSIIVEFSLTVMLGSSTAASEGLLEMQRAMDAGILTRIAGSPLDSNYAVQREGWNQHTECETCHECDASATGHPTSAPTTAPTAILADCFSSDEISGNGVMVGFFIGIAILLGTGFLAYLCYWGYQEWIVKDLNERVEMKQLQQ